MKQGYCLSDLTEDEKRFISALRNPDDGMKQRFAELMNSDNPVLAEAAGRCVEIITENQKQKEGARA